MRSGFSFGRSIVLALGVGLLAGSISTATTPAQFSARGPGGGGALFAPSFSPYTNGEMYLACDMSEVFHSTNFGANWSVTDFRQIQGGRQAIVQFTSDPRVLYTIDLSDDLMTPTRSLDSGATWQQLTNEPTGGGAFALFADPAGTNRLIVSDYTTVYLSTDGGKSFSSKFTYSPASGNGCLLAGAFFDGTNIFVGTSAGLLVSSNNGTSFALANVSGIPSTQAMFSFAGAKQGGVTRFLCVALNASDVYPGMDIEGYYGSYQSVYGLDWGQSSWAVRTSGILAGHEPVFVAMARNDTGTAYVAGQQSSIDYPVLYKSSNGGVNWSPVLLITNNQNVYTGWAGNGGDRDWSYG